MKEIKYEKYEDETVAVLEKRKERKKPGWDKIKIYKTKIRQNKTNQNKRNEDQRKLIINKTKKRKKDNTDNYDQ